jgi:hypothetical protein
MSSARKPLRACLPLMVAVAVAVAAASASAALAAWSAPTTVSAPHDSVDDLQLASGPAGDLLTWESSDLVPPMRQDFEPIVARYAVAPAGGSFGPERTLPASYAGGRLVNLGGGRIAQLIFVPGADGTHTPEVALGRVDGSFGAPQRVRASVFNYAATVAGDPRGDVLLAWVTGPYSRRKLWASVRPAGGRFGTPHCLSASHAGLAVTAAVGTQGDMVVAWDANGRVYASVRRHGHAWRPVQNLGAAAVGTLNQVAPYVGGDGRVIVAWYHEQLSGDGPSVPGYTQVAVQPPGAGRFEAAQTLARDPSGSWNGSEPVVVANGTDGWLVAFLAQPGPTLNNLNPPILKVAYGNGNRLDAPQTISPPGQQASFLAAAAGPRGAIVTWTASPTSAPYAPAETAVYAAFGTPPAGRLGAPQQVSPADEHAVDAVATYSPSGDRWIVAWMARLQYQSPLNPGPMVVRAAFCEAACQ